MLTCIYWSLWVLILHCIPSSSVSNKLLFCWKTWKLPPHRLLLLWRLNVQHAAAQLRLVHEKNENLMKTLNGLYYPTREQTTRQTNLFCLCSAHITQNQYSPNKVRHTLSLLCNYVSQMQLLGNYLCPLFLHEPQDKTDIVWSFIHQSDCLPVQ